jgi:hypothetical protein
VSSGAGVQHSLSGKSAQELSHTGSHVSHRQRGGEGLSMPA